MDGTRTGVSAPHYIMMSFPLQQGVYLWRIPSMAWPCRAMGHGFRMRVEATRFRTIRLCRLSRVMGLGGISGRRRCACLMRQGRRLTRASGVWLGTRFLPLYAFSTAASNTRTDAFQISRPVPSPSINGTIGLSGIRYFPSAYVIRWPPPGTATPLKESAIEHLNPLIENLQL